MTQAKAKAKDEGTGLRNRIVGLEVVPAVQLQVNSKNWRIHPEEQRAALSSLMETIGVADAVLAYHSDRNNGALTLIDGHLRRELLTGDVPVLVTDLNDEEADALLASHDVITTMAVPDEDELAALLDDIRDSLPRDVLLAIDPDLEGDPDAYLADGDAPLAKYPIVPLLDEGYDYVVIFCARESEFAWLRTVLDLPVARDRKRIGVSRVLTASQFRELWSARSS